MLFLLQAAPAGELIQRITADFGIRNFSPSHWEKTTSGGWRAEDGPIRLSIDAGGSVRELKIKQVKFEASDAGRTRAKIASLLRNYPLPLGEGKWVTERSLSPHPYGDAKTSMRYFFVPMRHGYPFLNGSHMTVQVSQDQKRILEWSFHPWEVPMCPKPKSVISQKTAVAMMTAEAKRRSTATLKYTIAPKVIMCGWRSHKDATLIYFGIATAPINPPPRTLVSTAGLGI